GQESHMKPHPQNHSLAPAMQTLRAPLQATLLVLGGVAGAIFITTFSLVGAISPAYAFMRDTISGLEFSPFGYLQQLNFVVFGLVQATFAYALRAELTGGRGAVSIPAVQLICACAVVGDGVFIRYPAHLTCDLIAFNSTLVALFLFAWRFWRDPRWKGWSWYSIATAVAMIICLAIFGICNRQGGPAGLF